ncbi:MAG: cupin domain-containing protein [Anaerolineae bacterium]|nr:cupin domain-containing protein [Anaerolineae bacterium]
MVTHAVDKHPEEVMPGVLRTVLSYGEKLMLTENFLKEGSQVPAHAHPHEQITYVVRGTVKFTLSGKEFVLAAGECCLIPGNEPHGVEALSDCVLLDAFSPPREDFLQK